MWSLRNRGRYEWLPVVPTLSHRPDTGALDGNLIRLHDASTPQLLSIARLIIDDARNNAPRLKNNSTLEFFFFQSGNEISKPIVVNVPAGAKVDFATYCVTGAGEARSTVKPMVASFPSLFSPPLANERRKWAAGNARLSC